jgi:hypothetical protein
MAPTKAMARYAVTTLSLPTNVMTLLPEIPLGIASVMVNRNSPFEKVSLAVVRLRLPARHGKAKLKSTR